MTEQTFEYGGYHFTPERQLSSTESSIESISRHQRIDPELGFCRKNYNYKSKFEYSYDKFYAVATEKEFDLFRCEENGKLYIPCENDLQEYVEENRIKQQEHICDIVQASVAKEFAEFRSKEIAQSAEAVFDNNCQIHFYSRVANYFECDNKQFYEKNAIRCLQKYTGHILDYLWDYYLNCDQVVNLDSSLGVYSFIRDFNGEYMAYDEPSGEME